MKLWFPLAAVLCAMAGGNGCSLFSDPCGAVMPTVITTQAQLADVQRAIADVEASGIMDSLPEAQRQRYDEAMGKLRHGYAIAVQSLALASDACSEPDLRGALRLIVEGWDVVRSFISLVGGPGVQTHEIADPIIYSESRR
jgi:hypothetical protein